MRNVECGMRNGCGTLDALAPARSPNVNSALRIPHSQFESCDPGFLAQRASDLIRSREQHLPPVGLHGERGAEDRKSTRLNSSHLVISYAVFCLKKKKDMNR